MGRLISFGMGILKQLKEPKSPIFKTLYAKRTSPDHYEKSGITSFAQMKDKILGAQNGSSGYDAFIKQPKILKDIVKIRMLFYMIALMKH